MSNAFLIDYKWCTGCHACEIACQMLHGFPPDEFGIKVETIGPWEHSDGKWVLENTVFFTPQCDQCAMRQAEGLPPTCVQHCQAQCLKYGPLDQMVEELKKNPKQVIQGL